MTVNVGIDVIEIDRVKNMADNESHLSKVFTDREIEYFDRFSEKFSHIAGNFCVKEAFVKALKTGFKGIAPKDVELLHDENGAPYINLDNDKIQSLLPSCAKVDVNISHSKTVATAICIIYI